MSQKPIKTALISAYKKEGLDEIVKMLHANEVVIYSTGQTASFIQELGIPVVSVSAITGFPEILDGRVKTLHPSIFGGILAIRNNVVHVSQVQLHNIPFIDLVIVDLYPFVETLAKKDVTQSEIIEQIDIGGVSLLRAAAKNFEDVVVFAGNKIFPTIAVLFENGLSTTRAQRFQYAAKTFAYTAEYEHNIDQYFNHYADEPSDDNSASTGSVSK